MKKIMIALMTVVIAAVSHAATVQWSAMVTGSSSGITPGNYTAYFFTSEYDGTQAGLDLAADNQVFFYNEDTVMATGNKTFGSSATSLDWSVVMVDNVANKYAVIGTGTGYVPYGPTDPAVSADATTSKKAVLGTYTDASKNLTWTAVSVPEPTSGLLLLLGVAGLALRRRHA